MNWAAFWITVFFTMFGVALQGYVAYKQGWFFPSQLIAAGEEGRPFVAHPGMWSDFFLLPWILGIAVGMYGREWSLGQIQSTFVVWLIVSALIHQFMYAPASRDIPEAHARDGKVTAPGWIHVPYFAAGTTIPTLLFFASTSTPLPSIMALNVVGLTVHTICAVHVPFNAWALDARPMWFPMKKLKGYVDNAGLATIFGVFAALTLASIYRTLH